MIEKHLNNPDEKELLQKKITAAITGICFGEEKYLNLNHPQPPHVREFCLTELVKITNFYNGMWGYQYLMNFAAALDNPCLIRFIYEKNIPAKNEKEEAVLRAIKENRIFNLKLLHELGAPITEWAMICAASFHNIKIMQQLHDWNAPITELAMTFAICKENSIFEDNELLEERIKSIKLLLEWNIPVTQDEINHLVCTLGTSVLKVLLEENVCFDSAEALDILSHYVAHEESEINIQKQNEIFNLLTKRK